MFYHLQFQTEQSTDLSSKLKAIFKELIDDELKPITNALQPLFEAITDLLDFIKAVKTAYKTLKDV